MGIQLFEALCHLHSNQYVHCDVVSFLNLLKHSNILLRNLKMSFYKETEL